MDLDLYIWCLFVGEGWGKVGAYDRGAMFHGEHPSYCKVVESPALWGEAS